MTIVAFVSKLLLTFLTIRSKLGAGTLDRRPPKNNSGNCLQFGVPLGRLHSILGAIVIGSPMVKSRMAFGLQKEVKAQNIPDLKSPAI